MTSEAKTVEKYLNEVPEERRAAFRKLRDTIKSSIPDGFEECISYGQIGWVVPHSLYPDGYHCDPKLPLPFISIASQKNFVALYHMGIYADPALLEWFTSEYPKHSATKLDMGKSCVRFKKPDAIPFELIAETVSKITVDDWIKLYTTTFRDPRQKK